MVEDISSTFDKMAALSVKVAIPEIPMENFLSSLAQQEKLYQSVADIAQLSKEPLTSLVDAITSIKLPEPYLFNALIGSGLNSSIIHSPTYILPEMVPIYADTELDEIAANTNRR